MGNEKNVYSLGTTINDDDVGFSRLSNDPNYIVTFSVYSGGGENILSIFLFSFVFFDRIET